MVCEFIYLLLDLFALEVPLFECQVGLAHLGVRLISRFIFLVVVAFFYLLLFLILPLLFQLLFLLQVFQLMLFLFLVFILFLFLFLFFFFFFLFWLRCCTRSLKLELAISNLSALFVGCRGHDLSATEY